LHCGGLAVGHLSILLAGSASDRHFVAACGPTRQVWSTALLRDILCILPEVDDVGTAALFAALLWCCVASAALHVT
jgi:hypothetical protein